MKEALGTNPCSKPAQSHIMKNIDNQTPLYPLVYHFEPKPFVSFQHLSQISYEIIQDCDLTNQLDIQMQYASRKEKEKRKSKTLEKEKKNDEISKEPKIVNMTTK